MYGVGAAEGGAETELGGSAGGRPCCEALVERPGMRSLSPLGAWFAIERREFRGCVAEVSKGLGAGGPIAL